MRREVIAALKAEVFQKCVKKAHLYHVTNSPSAIDEYRLQRFNVVWKDAYSNLPFYRAFREQHGLPLELSSLDELATWPIVRKSDLQREPSSLLRQDAPDGWILTGGSTGEPLKLGAWHGGDDVSANQWVGRSGAGISPEMKAVLLWGHQHLYGKGINRRIQTAKRYVKDQALNFTRLPGYDLSDSVLRSQFDVVLRESPKYIISFSATLLAMCRTNASFADSARNLGLVCVICTSGPLSLGERLEIAHFWGCPVVMEYGAAECGVMAYSSAEDDAYDVFWDTHLLELVKEDGGVRNVVTRLTREYCPLIRYDSGDFVTPLGEHDTARPVRLRSVEGRANDVLQFDNGTRVYAALVNDCVKQVPKITAVQMLPRGRVLRIRVLCCEKLTAEDEQLIRDRCVAVAPGLSEVQIAIEQCDVLKRVASGKTPLVLWS